MLLEEMFLSKMIRGFEREGCFINQSVYSASCGIIVCVSHVMDTCYLRRPVFESAL